MRPSAVASSALPLLLMMLASWVALPLGDAHAEPPDWQLKDFRPLTELPWTRPEPDAPAPPLEEETLRKIFREPNLFIRYPVLADYLRLIQVDDLGRAFDLCIDLEGTQMPDNLVPFFIRIWAERDPKGCWERVETLFQIVAIDDGWLAYDSWGNSRIEVKNLEAVRASKFWLRSESLLTFPLGVDAAKLKAGERTEYLRAFALKWFKMFESWPGAPAKPYGLEFENGLASALAAPVGPFDDGVSSTTFLKDAPFYELSVRRQLVDKPSRALEIVEEIRTKVWSDDYHDDAKNESPFTVVAHEPSLEFVQLWSELNLPALLQWVDTLPAERRETGLAVKGLLMSRVDEETRARWLQGAQKRPPDNKGDSDYVRLLGYWARWDLVPAFGAALAAKDVDGAISVAAYALPYDVSGLRNLRLAKVRQIARLDVTTIPPEIRDALLVNFFVFT
ncbi:MAG: hypothetical protein ACAH88_10315, partial [Roseimicrobium sp.]